MPREIDYFQQQFGEDVYEDTEPVESAPAVSDEEIKAFVEANIGNPALIAETAAQYGVSVADLSRATGYDTSVVVDYFQQADVAPPSTGGSNATAVTETPPPVVVDTPPPPPTTDIVETPPPTKIVETNAPVDLGDGTFRTPGGTIIDGDGRPVTKAVDTNTTTTTTPAATTAATTATTTPATTTTLPTVTDGDGNQFDGAQLLTLARQIAENAGSMTGGAFQTKGESIGFAASEANNLLGRTATASEQVLLDMARQMIQAGVTDLGQIKTQDILSDNVSVQLDPDTNQYYALIPSGDGETSTRQDLTADQVARIRTESVMQNSDSDASFRRVIDDLVTGQGLYAGDKLLTQQNAYDNPIGYTIGATYTGGGGTNYELKFDPKTGKSVVSANGFTTSDAEMLMPIIMIASNFLLPGASSFLSSTLLEAGMGELTSQIVSKSIINGVTSGIMAEASGGDFGDGFLKGAVTGAVSAGVAPMIQTALPSDLSPVVSNALTRAGTAAVTALATGKDVGTAMGTQLLNSVVSTGLGSVTGELGLSTADAKLLNSVLTPMVTQLVTNGNVSDTTLMNAVMLAGSTVLANIDSGAVNNVSTLTTGSDSDKAVGGLNLLANQTGNETLTDLASTVNTGLNLASTATGLLGKVTSLTNVPKTKVNKTKANLTGVLRTNTPTTGATTRTAAVKPAALGALNTTKKTLTAQEIASRKATKPPTQVNVADLTPIKTPPKKVDVKTLIPVKTAQLPAGLNTKKMG